MIDMADPSDSQIPNRAAWEADWLPQCGRLTLSGVPATSDGVSDW
jgi:hypothetical protein